MNRGSVLGPARGSPAAWGGFFTRRVSRHGGAERAGLPSMVLVLHESRQNVGHDVSTIGSVITASSSILWLVMFSLFIVILFFVDDYFREVQLHKLKIIFFLVAGLNIEGVLPRTEIPGQHFRDEMRRSITMFENKGFWLEI